jgi:hypothetical protein
MKLSNYSFPNRSTDASHEEKEGRIPSVSREKLVDSMYRTFIEDTHKEIGYSLQELNELARFLSIPLVNPKGKQKLIEDIYKIYKQNYGFAEDDPTQN